MLRYIFRLQYFAAKRYNDVDDLKDFKSDILFETFVILAVNTIDHLIVKQQVTLLIFFKYILLVLFIAF